MMSHVFLLRSGRAVRGAFRNVCRKQKARQALKSEVFNNLPRQILCQSSIIGKCNRRTQLCAARREGSARICLLWRMADLLLMGLRLDANRATEGRQLQGGCALVVSPKQGVAVIGDGRVMRPSRQLKRINQLASH